jgi:hypothetical protein
MRRVIEPSEEAQSLTFKASNEQGDTLDIDQDLVPEIPNQPNSRLKIPDQLAGIFGDPPLLQGEDPKLYQALLDAVIDDRQPKGFEDWIYVYETVTKLWEEQRLRRASAGLLRSGMFRALRYFLIAIHSDGGLPDFAEARELAFKYFHRDEKERKKVTSLLAQYGITPEALQAKAAQDNSDAVQMFEAMISRREKSRRKLRKEDQGLRRRRGSQKD